MEAQKSGTGLKKVFIGFLIALAATNGVTLYFLLSENHQKNIVIVEKTSLEQDYKNVTDALDSKKTEIEQLRGKNDEMDKLINEKEKLIEDEKKITVTEIYVRLKLEQSVASQHLAILRKAGIVTTQRDGKFIFYIINHKRIDEISAFVNELVA